MTVPAARAAARAAAAGIMITVLRGESNVAIVPAIRGYAAEDIYLGEFSPHAGQQKGKGTTHLPVFTRRG